jgi:predicted SprT family Zn-dependent metalloprotease
MDKLQEIESFATELIHEYLPHFRFEWMNKKRVIGDCSSYKQRIRLSKHFVEYLPEDKILDTILHEISHGIVGTKNGHNHVWKKKCIEIGAKPERCKTVEIVGHKYEANCKNECKVVAKYHRKPQWGYFGKCKTCGEGIYTNKI